MRARYVNHLDEGWWSADIYGGDAACDIRDSLIRDFGIDFETYLHNKKDPEVIEKIGNALTVESLMLDKLKNWYEDEIPEEQMTYGYEVLGQFLMDAGVPIGNTLKERIIDWAKKDKWANEEAERKQVIDNFINKIKTY
jgi:hypothetical protein